MNTLRIRWTGGEAAFEPGRTVRIGRDVDAEVQPKNPNVSRHHAEISHTPSGWTLRDLGSAQGTWRDGRQVESVDVRGTIQVTLGREGRGEVLTLEASPAGAPQNGTQIVGTPVGGMTEVVGGRVSHGSGQAAATGEGTVVVGATSNRPGGALRADAIAGATVVTSDSLNVECAGRSYTFQPGEQISIGRDAQCDIVSTNPTVSRRHARLRHDGTKWTIHDEGSAGGTYIDGKRITEHPLAGSVAAWLGDETTGERLVMVASGKNPSAGKKRKRRGALPIAVGVAAIVLLAAVAVFVATRDNDEDKSGPSVDHLARATVRLIAGDFGGSGTIIDAKKGLILTNAHVAAPAAPGSAVRDRKFDYALDPNPREIRVLVAPALGKAAEPRFVAEVVAVDGYADLAVLRITKTTIGQLVEPDDLDDLVDVKIGDSAAVVPGDSIRVFGYPGASQSDGVTLVDGLVSGQVQDERIGSTRAMLNISAPIFAGNSGGLAVDDKGELIGVPTLKRDDAVGSMRPSTFATPLIEAAESDEPYVSPYIKPITSETISDVRLSAPDAVDGTRFDCATGDPVSPEVGAVGVSFTYKGFVEGQHQDLLVVVFSGGTAIGLWSLADDEYPVRWPSATGCATITVPVDPSRITDPSQPLEPVIGIGPNYTTPD